MFNIILIKNYFPFRSWNTLLLITGVCLITGSLGCGSDDAGTAFSPDFEFSFINDNLVKFENTSSGEYYSANWDFDNGQMEETIDKNKNYQIVYTDAGDYDVSLKLLDFVGNTKTVNKTVSISAANFSVQFRAEVLSGNPNIVQLTNETVGEYDSFKWLFRGKEVDDQLTHDAYFPFIGTYTIELVVLKGGVPFTEQKTINILADDANYVDNLELIWSDEFDGTSINTSDWTFETGASGWGNNELQNYTSGNNAEMANGVLTITARKVNDNMQPGSYTSSRIISKGKQEFQYGRIEIRANLPEGRGIWPALWMLGGDISTIGWPACGEIDILEYVGYEPNVVHATVHTPAGFGGGGNGSSFSLETCEEEFHNYGVVWTQNKLEFYIDDPSNIIHTYAPSNKNDNNWPFDKTAFFILNIAVGGNWGGAQGIDNGIFPQTMEIDYVRVYQEL